jgi:hypothetical protein
MFFFALEVLNIKNKIRKVILTFSCFWNYFKRKFIYNLPSTFELDFFKLVSLRCFTLKS